MLAMPLPRSLANLKREISEKKRVEARQQARGRAPKTKYRMPASQRPDGTVTGSKKRLASRFYQIKTGHCLSGRYLYWTENQATPQYWWCQYRIQTRDYLFKECPEWKPQQNILWAEVGRRPEAGRAGGVSGTPGGREVQPGGVGLSRFYRRGKESYQPRRSRHCFSLRPPSWHPRTRRRGWDELPFVHLLRSPPCGQPTGNASYIISPWSR